MKKYTIHIISIVTVLLLSIFLFSSNQNKKDDFLVRHNLQEMNIYQIVAYLENSLDEPIDFRAGINSTNLLLSDDKGSLNLALPSDMFYLSMAPYITQTHPCSIHNLVTCRGELKEVTLQVLVRDIATNEVILDEDVETFSNGFAGLWLPRDGRFSITVTYDGLSSTTEVSTFEDDNTCETTLKLV